MLVYPVHAKWVDLVQRLEFAFAVPPAMGKGLEFSDFSVVDVAHGSVRFECLREKLESQTRMLPAQDAVGAPIRPLVHMSYGRGGAAQFRLSHPWPRSLLDIFSPHWRAFAITRCSSIRVSRPLSSNCLPPTQTCRADSLLVE